jgi:hypothetical protein
VGLLEWAAGRHLFALSPLSDVESATLLNALLGRPALDADIQESLLERAGGNPLYAEEFARMTDGLPFYLRCYRTERNLVELRAAQTA